jgi:transcriptional regulator with XRE-family HTH domain
VRNLRKRLGETQQQFAERMGMAISTVVRYELSRPPRGKVLLDLAKLAEESSCRREAKIFRYAFYREFEVYGDGTPPFPYLRLTPQNEREEELIQALLWAARHSPEMQKIEEQLKSSLIEKTEFETAMEDTATEWLILRDGSTAALPLEAVAERIGGTPERARLWLSVVDTFEMDRRGFRSLLQRIALGEAHIGLADKYLVSISTVQTLKRLYSDLVIINRAQHSEKREAESSRTGAGEKAEAEGQE